MATKKIKVVRTPRDPNRPLKQKTYDYYEDQLEHLELLSKKVGRPVQYLIRLAIDQMYNLPKVKPDETQTP